MAIVPHPFAACTLHGTRDKDPARTALVEAAPVHMRSIHPDDVLVPLHDGDAHVRCLHIVCTPHGTFDRDPVRAAPAKTVSVLVRCVPRDDVSVPSPNVVERGAKINTGPQ